MELKEFKRRMEGLMMDASCREKENGRLKSEMKQLRKRTRAIRNLRGREGTDKPVTSFSNEHVNHGVYDHQGDDAHLTRGNEHLQAAHSADQVDGDHDGLPRKGWILEDRFGHDRSGNDRFGHDDHLENQPSISMEAFSATADYEFEKGGTTRISNDLLTDHKSPNRLASTCTSITETRVLQHVEGMDGSEDLAGTITESDISASPSSAMPIPTSSGDGGKEESEARVMEEGGRSTVTQIPDADRASESDSCCMSENMSENMSESVQALRLSLLRSKKSTLFRHQDSSWFSALEEWWKQPKARARSRGELAAVPPGNADCGGNFVRVLSLRQARQLIMDLIDSKTRYDKKCAHSNLSRETMEQHLYTFLNQRFGIKPLIVEWASAILNAVSKFSAMDIDLLVFGKILLNEVEEEFWQAHVQLKQTTIEVLRAYLRAKYTFKSEKEIRKMLYRRFYAEIEDVEWVDVIKYMYDGEESGVLIKKVNKQKTEGTAAIVMGNEASRIQFPIPSSSASMSDSKPGLKAQSTRKGKLPFGVLIQVLLRHQLEEHLRILRPFRELFLKCDPSGSGILTIGQFEKFYSDRYPNSSKQDIASAIDKVFSECSSIQKVATFSDCVLFFNQGCLQIICSRLRSKNAKN